MQPIAGNDALRATATIAIDLAHQLGVKVVGEGVDSEAACSQLREIGCDIGQGYFLGRPLAAAAFTEWMAEPARRVVPREASGYPPAGPPTSARPREFSASWAAGRAVGLARRTVKAVGPGTLTAAVAMIAAYGLWQALRWGGRAHQALIGTWRSCR